MSFPQIRHMMYAVVLAIDKRIAALPQLLLRNELLQLLMGELLPACRWGSAYGHRRAADARSALPCGSGSGASGRREAGSHQNQQEGAREDQGAPCSPAWITIERVQSERHKFQSHSTSVCSGRSLHITSKEASLTSLQFDI